MEQFVQIGGAVAILAAFIALQAGAVQATSWSYLLLNVAGAVVLAVVAAADRDWGFLLLETVWTAVSGWSVIRKLRTSREPENVRPEGLEPPTF
jgi:steroid 5-alpha reductase family enzyme